MKAQFISGQATVFSIVFFSLLAICSCKNNSKSTSLSDDEFISSFQKPTFQKSVEAIDSALANHTFEDKKRALLYFEKAKKQVRLNDYESAVPNLKKALALLKKLKNDEYFAEIYWQLGSAYIFLSRKEIATEHLLKSLEYCKIHDKKRVEANVYSSLSHTYYLYKDYQKSIDYTLKAIEIQKDLNDTLNLSSTYNNLAVLYRNTEDYSNALKYNQKSLEINILYHDTSSIAKSYNNLGLASEGLEDYSSAINYYLKAIALNESINEPNSSPLQNLGNYYLRNDKIQEAEKYYLKALSLENQAGDLFAKQKINNEFLNVSLLKKDFESAIYYTQKRDSINVILSEIETEEKLNLVEKQYKLVSKEKDLAQAQRIIKKNKIIFISIAGFILLLALFWFQWLRNRKLKNEKEKMALEQKILRSQMNPHFIFNALSAIQNSLMDNDSIKSASYLSRFAKLIRQNFDFVNQKTISLTEEIDALKNYMDTQIMRFNNKFEYEIIISESIFTDEVRIPPLLLQPFVENSIEHAFKDKSDKGKITVEITETPEGHHYTIKDNGSGYDTMKTSNQDHAIDIFKKRMKLLGNKEGELFKIESDSNGTIVQFNLRTV